jgi:hypothetical protein
MNGALAYYQEVAGEWKGALDFRITAWRVFFRQRMSLRERARAIQTTLLCKFGVQLMLRTGVVVLSDTSIQHATMVTWRGFILLSGVEDITLGESSVDIVCNHSAMGHSWRFNGSAVSSKDGRSVDYIFSPWFGTELHQRGTIVGNHVRLDQTTPWFSGRQVLQRTK